LKRHIRQKIKHFSAINWANRFYSCIQHSLTPHICGCFCPHSAWTNSSHTKWPHCKTCLNGMGSSHTSVWLSPLLLKHSVPLSVQISWMTLLLTFGGDYRGRLSPQCTPSCFVRYVNQGMWGRCNLFCSWYERVGFHEHSSSVSQLRPICFGTPGASGTDGWPCKGFCVKSERWIEWGLQCTFNAKPPFIQCSLIFTDIVSVFPSNVFSLESWFLMPWCLEVWIERSIHPPPPCQNRSTSTQSNFS